MIRTERTVSLNDQKFPLFFKADCPPGQHSRRHWSRDAQDAARAAYLYLRGPDARRRRVAERAEAAELQKLAQPKHDDRDREKRRGRRRGGKRRSFDDDGYDW